MADDWDLYAVVRSCFNAAATSTASSSTTTGAAIAPVENSSLPSGETSLSSSFLASPSFQSGHTSSDFPGFANHTRDSFRGLEEIYKEPYEDIVQSFVDLNSQAQHIQAIQGPGCTADQTPQQQRIYGQPQQLMQQPQRYSHLSREMFVGASLSFPSTSPQPERPRRRKNQQAKRIQQMTQEELSADSWAWRKYGQKPIKDSPYPRNYYRCSTSKGCTARKQVERCPADPSMYVVSYSGEHSHPRPTHRSSLAGTTRSKVPPAAAAAARPPTTTTATTTSTTNIHNIASSSMASCSSSSPASASSFSPTATPITEGESGVDENVDQETADNENNNSYGAELLLSGEEEVEGWADDGDDDDENDGDGNGDDDILIPNYALVNDDRFFKGLHFKD